MIDIFYLGTKYSKPFNAVYSNQQGERKLLEMGCYGIGVTRAVAAVVESLRDDKGVIWPEAIAPYRAIIIPISNPRNVEGDPGHL
jgi:prolyl-tRNA synthetase